MKPYYPIITRYSVLLAVIWLNGCDSGTNYQVQTAPKPKESNKSSCNSLVTKSNKLDAQNSMDDALKFDYGLAFLPAFQLGNSLFEKSFTTAQGGGANVGGHERYTRVPRADHECPGEWALHVPARATGPNAQSCLDCHSRPNDGAGSIASNAQRDPLHSGDIRKFIQRNTPHLFGGGAVQLLAEDMTDELHQIQTNVGHEACKSGQPVRRALTTKTINFGAIKAVCKNGKPTYDTAEVKGIARDLIIRPFQWKKSMLTVRDFVLDAAHNEIGMQAVELPGVGPASDGDGDGVINELTVSQVTALTVYMAAQPRPTTRTELTDANIISKYQDKLKMIPVTADDRSQIKRGAEVFADIGCAECHKPEVTLSATKNWFKEPKGSEGVVKFDITKGMSEGGTPDNQDKSKNGYPLGAFNETDSSGNIIIRLFGDLKRHDMGAELAEAIDEPTSDARMGIGRSTFGTKELWGVGCTGPWLHDGRATTLTEAIHFHGGEASSSRGKFNLLNTSSKEDLFAFLYNQVLYLHEFGEDLPNDRGICGKVADEFQG